jgi:hypothetical protein
LRDFNRLTRLSGTKRNLRNGDTFRQYDGTEMIHLARKHVPLWLKSAYTAFMAVLWPAPGSEDTKLGVFMGPEVSHGATKIYAGV